MPHHRLHPEPGSRRPEFHPMPHNRLIGHKLYLARQGRGMPGIRGWKGPAA